jgi:hypothetical protein
VQKPYRYQWQDINKTIKKNQGYIKQDAPRIYNTGVKVKRNEFTTTCIYEETNGQTEITQHSSKAFIYKYVFGGGYGYLHFTQAQQKKGKGQV